MDADNRAAVEAYKAAVQSGDMTKLGEMIDEFASDDFVQEWPQSGERIRGKQMAKKIGEDYSGATGTTPKFKVDKIQGSGDLYVMQGVIDYGDGTPVSYVGVAEFRDGKVAKVTEYFANPFEAPEWRKPYTERMEPVSV